MTAHGRLYVVRRFVRPRRFKLGPTSTSDSDCNLTTFRLKTNIIFASWDWQRRSTTSSTIPFVTPVFLCFEFKTIYLKSKEPPRECAAVVKVGRKQKCLEITSINFYRLYRLQCDKRRLRFCDVRILKVVYCIFSCVVIIRKLTKIASFVSFDLKIIILYLD